MGPGIRSGILAAGLVLAAAVSATAASGGRWTKEFTEPWFDGHVDVVTTWRGYVVIAGEFEWLDGRPLGSPALWDGETWQTLGGGVNGTVHVIYENYGGDLWVGGEFTQAGNVEAHGIARWNGQWHAAGDGIDGVVHDIVSWVPGIVAVGEFPPTGENGSENIAVWDGTGWSGIGGGWLRNGPILTTTTFEGKLVLGGEFSYGNGIAFWDGIDWQLPGGWGLNSCDASGDAVVRDMGRNGNWLHIVGDFRAPPHSARNIARFVGDGWVPVGTEFDDCRTITDFESFNGHAWVVAEGELWTLRTEGWVQMDAGPFTRVNMVSGTGGQLFVGGDRGWAGDVTRLDLADEWIYARPDRVTGFQGSVSCMIPWGDAIVAGGGFAGVAGVPTTRVAMRNGTTWQPLGEGLNANVHCLTVHEGALVAGGSFNGSGFNTLARRAARWNGDAWESLGAGFTDGTVTKLLSDAGELLAIGSFTEAAGVPLQGVAAWSGSQWSQRGSPVPGILDLARVNGELMAGGAFALPDGGNALARWNGTDWESFPGEPDGAVHRIAEFRGELIVVGDFQNIGGVSARRVARWDGGAWSPLGAGANARVNRFTEYAGQLYVAGDFSEMDGKPAARVAHWDGREWWPLGEGVYCAALALLPVDGRLWIAGALIRAGGFPAPRIASWTQPVSVPGFDLAAAPDEFLAPAPIVLRAWPNPAAGSAEQSIGFSLPARADVMLTVHDIAGRLVRTVTARGLPAGRGEVRWDGRDDAGRRSAAGVYFVRLVAAGQSVTQKIVRVD